MRLGYNQGRENKIDALGTWISDHGQEAQRLVYVGNDVNDLECMAEMGYAAVPADAHPEAIPAASLVLRSQGSRGAIRELADLIL